MCFQQVLPEMLASLGTLISGVKAETLRVLPTDTLLTALPNITLQRSRLSPAQHTAITTKLWVCLLLHSDSQHAERYTALPALG